VSPGSFLEIDVSRTVPVAKVAVMRAFASECPALMCPECPEKWTYVPNSEHHRVIL
jgi:hypothetical protein